MPRVVVVTGGSAGVGRAVARAFARSGASVGLLARGEDGLKSAAREIRDIGGRAIPILTDVADADAVEAAAARVEAELGPIDVWVNNAMVSVFSCVRAMTPADYRRVTEVTFLGTVYGTLAALRRMRPRERGVIVQVGSALAYRAIPLQSAYCAAKHAVQGFTESLRSELLHERSGVRVTMVQLPALNTPQFRWSKSRLPRKARPVPPIFQPEVAARAVMYAAEHARDEMYVSWPAVKAIVANRIAPRLLDRYLAWTGYDAQQTDEPEIPDRPHNLWRPLPGDHGAHGVFDAQAKARSWQLALSTHRATAATCGLALVGAAGFAWMRRR